MVDMVENIMEASRTVTRTADIVKDYEGLRAQFNNRAGPAPARGTETTSSPSTARTGPPSRTRS